MIYVICHVYHVKPYLLCHIIPFHISHAIFHTIFIMAYPPLPTCFISHTISPMSYNICHVIFSHAISHMTYIPLSISCSIYFVNIYCAICARTIFKVLSQLCYIMCRLSRDTSMAPYIWCHIRLHCF
jgi:hypothetical protein